MMAYKINQRDVEFVLFEQLKVQQLNQFEKYQGYTQDDFQAILEGSLKFAQNDMAPLNKGSDEVGCHLSQGKVTTPPGFKEAFKKSAELGLIAIDIPTTYGGQGLPTIISTAIQEYLAGACITLTMYMGLTRGAGHLIETFGTQKLAELYCQKMYSGLWAGTMCLTEPQAGSAVGDLKTSATPQPNGSYRIKGNKIFISAGDHDLTENIVHLVLARIEGDPAGTKGISLFAVPKIWVQEDGSLGKPNDVTTVNIEHKMGIKGSATCTLSFGDNNQCYGYLVGEACKGMSYMFQMMNEARIACGMQGMALGAVAYENALAYAKERIQGSNTPIIEYPDVKRMLVTQKAYVEGMRALLYQTAFFYDLSHHHSDPKQREYYAGQVALLTPICKAYCSDTGFKVTELALQTYGGYGYISEYPVEQLLRDAKISSIYEGTNGIQALDLIGRKLTHRSGEYFREFYERMNRFCEENAKRPWLEDMVAALKKHLEQLGQITLKFGEWAMSGDTVYPMFNATTYLSMFGDVVLAQLLCEQAILAREKLEKIWQETDADDEASKVKLIEENQEVHYLTGKVKSARFFCAHLLPQAMAKAKGILSGDRSALTTPL
ncbi:MAG: acyl-CoA dehydrogenase [Deltaproteobacteria bacterium]|nr:acyl-CoA dehydrogenase [Deltaproteobacteria bacterium]